METTPVQLPAPYLLLEVLVYDKFSSFITSFMRFLEVTCPAY